MIIDVHSHILPVEHMEKLMSWGSSRCAVTADATGRTIPTYKGAPFPGVTREMASTQGRVRDMDTAGRAPRLPALCKRRGLPPERNAAATLAKMDGVLPIRRKTNGGSWLTLGVVLAILACLGGLRVGVAGAQGTASVGAVMGTVRSQNNVALEGADVVLEGFGSAYSDSQGRFIFSRVPPGNYRLRVYKQGFTEYHRAMSVRAGFTERLDVVVGGFADPPTYGGGPVSVPLIRVGSSFLVRALLNGRQDVLFYVDTGASFTTISNQIARDIGIDVGPGSPTVTLITASGTIQAPVAVVESLQIGGVEARDVQVVVHDLPRGAAGIGLLGLSFLSRFSVRLDPDQGLLMLGQ